ncbi:hypothetical protein BGY98DRAFT_936385 [Russula aff. rugulosa BPL654]|nr:hypothetical protein BGY98DRAFT_936385 [Russula aff. rugulosa BPL654]
MGLVVSYLSKLDWTSLSLDIVELKLQHLIAELQHLQCVDVPHPARILNLSAKLKDTANTKTSQLSFQHKAVQDFHSKQADENDPPLSSVGVGPNAPSQPAQSQHVALLPLLTAMVMIKTELSVSQQCCIHKKSRTTLGNPQAVDVDGLLIDVDVQPVTNNSSTSEKLSTVQNMPSAHPSAYRNWAKCTNFLSKLPGDVKMQKVAAEEVTRTLDRDLREKKPYEEVIHYSDKSSAK